MKKTFGKILSILLVLTLIVSAVPISAYAASSTHSSHPICGSSCTCDSTHTNKSWTAWDGKTKITSGYYYLEDDVVFDSTFIHKSGYSIYLCLNGHNITSSDIAFDIYSYTSLIICDCKGTGKIESTNSSCTISNNGTLKVYGGKIQNNHPSAIATVGCWSTYGSLYMYGGAIESSTVSAVAVMPDSDIYVYGGNIHGYECAIDSNGGSPYNIGKFEMRGGNISATSADTYFGIVDLMQSDFTMSGGYIDGSVCVDDSDSTTKLSGGTINGKLDTRSATVSVTGGSCALVNNGGKCNVSAGTFSGTTEFGGTNNTVSAGNFTTCQEVNITAQTWIYGGYFDLIKVFDAPLYLSGVPEIDTIQIAKPGNVSAQNIDQSGSYAGDPIKIKLGDDYSTYSWKDGDIVIKNVKSDAVAEKFVIDGEDSRWNYLERVGDNLVLRILPHGKWGDNVTWGFKDGELTISGTGTIDYARSGYHYPWGDYRYEITKIVVEPGIVSIPSFTFEFCENAETIILPETLTDIKLNAFKNCRSLNNLLLPSSLISLGDHGNSYHSTFNACDSLSDVYFMGTEEEWNAVVNSNICYNLHRETKKHFLEYHETTATCTEPGVQGYYQFDDTSVYGGYYNDEKKPIAQLQTVPALGHRVADVPADTIEADCTNDVVCDYCQTVVKEAKGHRVIDEQVIQADPVTVENLSSKPFTNTNGTYYSTNTSHSSSSQLKITADYDCALKLNYGVSSESGYDKLIIKHNNTQKDAISGAVSNKTMTLNLNAGDTVTVSYSKDSSVSNNQDRGWVTLVYDQITVTESTDVPVEELDLKCDETVECDYCNTVIAGSSGHVSDEWIFDTLPSIYEAGKKHKECTVCGESYETDTVAEKIIPDINGDGKINSMDALIILNMSVGNEVNISDEAMLKTDVNGDGKVNSMDALIVLNIAVGKIKLED